MTKNQVEWLLLTINMCRVKADYPKTGHKWCWLQVGNKSNCNCDGTAKHTRTCQWDFTQLDFPVDELENAELDEVKALLTEFADVFALNDQELGCTTLTKHSQFDNSHTELL